MKILKARDILRRDVATIGPQVTAVDLAEFFTEEGIHGAPVVDAAGRLVGMVSRSDLVRSLAEERPEVISPLSLMSTDQVGNPDLPEPTLATFAGGSALTVSQIMTPDVVTATEDATAGELAALMHRNEIRRLAIVNGERMEGIVSVSDLLPVLARYERALSSGKEAASGPSERKNAPKGKNGGKGRQAGA